LHKTRREALRSKLERIFTVDVQTRVLREVAGSKLLQLDPALELRLVTASSEVIDERSGRIRFLPDGTSTGGRIQVQHDRERATVTVDRSTGGVTVKVNGD
jgi:general secretion pathway protein H